MAHLIHSSGGHLVHAAGGHLVHAASVSEHSFSIEGVYLKEGDTSRDYYPYDQWVDIVAVAVSAMAADSWSGVAGYYIAAVSESTHSYAFYREIDSVIAMVAVVDTSGESGSVSSFKLNVTDLPASPFVMKVAAVAQSALAPSDDWPFTSPSAESFSVTGTGEQTFTLSSPITLDDYFAVVVYFENYCPHEAPGADDDPDWSEYGQVNAQTVKLTY